MRQSDSTGSLTCGFANDAANLAQVCGKSGEAAFKFLEKKKPDLILLDYLMPNKDGPMVLKELRTMEGCESIPVIFLTGMSEKHIVIQTLTELMPQGYVVKPAKKSELVAKIIDVLG